MLGPEDAFGSHGPGRDMRDTHILVPALKETSEINKPHLKLLQTLLQPEF